MAEYVQKSTRPKVDAIQVTWSYPETIKSGMWIIKHPDGNTTYCDNEWFQANYVQA